MKYDNKINLLCVICFIFMASGCSHLKYADGRYRIYAKREIKYAARQVNLNRQKTRLLAGAAKVDITPPVGTPLAGYSARRGKPSLGIYDKLYSRALALKDGEDLLIIVSVDIIAIDDHLYESVFDRVTTKKGLASLGREDLMIIATHTHSGPGGIGIRFLEKLSTGHYDPEVFNFVVDGITESILKACNDLNPAMVGSDASLVKGVAGNRMIENGPVDSQLKVIRVDDEQSQPIAFFVNFAAHPTVLGKTNMYFSGDYPGSLSKILEEKYPGCVSLFSCGAAGDISPNSKNIGEILALEVIKISSQIKTAPDIELASAAVKVPLPAPRLRFSKLHLPSILSEPLLDRYGSFGVMHIGNMLLVGAPCDLNVETGLEIKQKIEDLGYNGSIIGYANDYIGYIIPEKYYYRDEYESSISFYGPDMDAYLKEIVFGLVDSVILKQFDVIDGISILYLSGTPYEMGFQHGSIMQNQIRGCVKEVLGYFRGYIKLPLLNRVITNVILDVTYNKMRPFIPPEYKDEMKGIADASGIPLSELHRLIALSEWTSSCSGFAAWGNATKDRRFYQMRNLDWNIHSGAQRYPVILVYHQQNKHKFLNIGYAGFAGVVSGINEEGIAVTEIGAKTKDYDFRGIPFVFLLRKLLEESDDLSEAVEIVKSANRTAGYNYVIGDSKASQAVALEVTKNLCAIFEDNDSKEVASKYGIPLKDAIFRSDTAFDTGVRDLQYASNGDPEKPGLESPIGSSAYDIRYKRQAEMLKEYYGRIDEKIAIKIAQEVAQGSNIQSLIYAWPDIYIANAEHTTPAAKTEYKYLNLKKLFEAAN